VSRGGWGNVLPNEFAADGVVKWWVRAAEEVVFCESCAGKHLLNSGDMNIGAAMRRARYCEFIRLKRKALKEVRGKHSGSLKWLTAGTRVVNGAHPTPFHHAILPNSPFYWMNRLNKRSTPNNNLHSFTLLIGL